MAKNNVINNATPSLTIDPGSAGDSFVQFNINATGEFRIGVDDTDDSFRIAQGSALGTNDTMIIAATGEITKPLQPAFSAYLASSDLNQTGNGAAYVLGTVTALTEIFDQGGDLGATGVFTAPVTGRYHLIFGVLIQEASTGTNTDPRIDTSNRTYRLITFSPSKVDVSGAFGVRGNVLADMDAADTAIVVAQVSGMAGDTADIFGAATNPSTFFSGFLEV